MIEHAQALQAGSLAREEFQLVMDGSRHDVFFTFEIPDTLCVAIPRFKRCSQAQGLERCSQAQGLDLCVDCQGPASKHTTSQLPRKADSCFISTRGARIGLMFSDN